MPSVLSPIGQIQPEEAERATRAAEIEAAFPRIYDHFISGCLTVGMAFRDAVQSYEYGLWVGTILSAQSAIEGNVHAVTKARAGTAFGLRDLFSDAFHHTLITDVERQRFAALRALAATYSGARDDTPFTDRLIQAGEMGVGLSELARDDARFAVTTACAYFQRTCLM